jgi:hypothetical protein
MSEIRAKLAETTKWPSLWRYINNMEEETTWKTWWRGHRYTAFSRHSELLHGELRETALELALQTPLLVAPHTRHLRHLAAWSWQTQRLPTPPKEHPSIHSVHRGNRKLRPPPIPGLGWLSRTQSVPQAHSHQSLPQRQVPSSPIQ